MKTKLIMICVVLGIVISCSACGEKEMDEQMESDYISEEQDTTEDETDEKEDNSEEEDIYSDNVHLVGDDISADTYVLKCISEDGGAEVVVFSDEEMYKDFLKTEKGTNGEYRNAVEAYAWSDFYLKSGESVFVGLEKGNVIAFEKDKCELNKNDISTSNVLNSGIYVVGKDINSGKTEIKCTSEYLRVTVFENSEMYLKYHKTSRFTIGEEEDAIKSFSASDDFLYTNDMVSLDTKDGMILMIDDGLGEYSITAGN